MDHNARPPLSSLLVLALALGIVGLCGLGFVLWRMATEKEPLPVDAPTSESVTFPMPKPPPGETPADRARGLYVLDAGSGRFSLDLQLGQRFRFLSSLDGEVKREGTGTWTLTGSVLTLTYTHVTGQPGITPEAPQVARNVWRGRTIELGDTGLQGAVVLTKRTVLRER